MLLVLEELHKLGSLFSTIIARPYACTNDTYTSDWFINILNRYMYGPTAGYRRITAQVDERHVIGRKFLERCGFTLECVLRKHKILQQRNSNTALYVVLNSEWLDVERKLKHSLGINLAPENHKIAAIEQPESGRKALVEGSQVAHAKSSKKSSKNKKKVNH